MEAQDAPGFDEWHDEETLGRLPSSVWTNLSAGGSHSSFCSSRSSEKVAHQPSQANNSRFNPLHLENAKICSSLVEAGKPLSRTLFFAGCIIHVSSFLCLVHL